MLWLATHLKEEFGTVAQTGDPSHGRISRSPYTRKRAWSIERTSTIETDSAVKERGTAISIEHEASGSQNHRVRM